MDLHSGQSSLLKVLKKYVKADFERNSFQHDQGNRTLIMEFRLSRPPHSIRLNETEQDKMAKGKTKSMAIKLLSTAGTGFFYVTTKNARTVPRKLNLKKVCNVFLLSCQTKFTNFPFSFL